MWWLFTGPPLQRSETSLRHTATARVDRTVHGTRYRRAGWPVCIRVRAMKVMTRPTPYAVLVETKGMKETTLKGGKLLASSCHSLSLPDAFDIL